MDVGVILFDDPEYAEEGWASIAGGEATRINGSGELDSKVLWVSNLTFPNWRRLNFSNSANVTHAQFFKTAPAQIKKELGIESDDRLAELSSEIYTRCHELGAHHGIVLTPGGYRYQQAVADKLMPSKLKALPDAKFRSELKYAFQASTQENQAMSSRSIPKGSTVASFYFPRVSYARWLLSQPLPENTHFTKIRAQKTPTVIGQREGDVHKGSRAAINRLVELSEEKAIFLKVNVTYVNKNMREYAQFGQGANHFRDWVTLPELLSLSTYCTIELHGGYMTDLGSELFKPSVLSTAHSASYSDGLFLENFWLAMASPRNQGDFKAAGAYLRALDRSACFAAAKFMHEQGGFVIGSFGAGRVQVFLRENEHASAINIANDCGLIPPLEIAR